MAAVLEVMILIAQLQVLQVLMDLVEVEEEASQETTEAQVLL